MTFSELKARVDAAEGEDMELDADIAVTLLGGETEMHMTRYTGEFYFVRKYPSTAHRSGFGKEPVAAYTSSLDAALGLVGAKLPGWKKSFGEGEAWLARVFNPDAGINAENDRFTAAGKTPSLALLSALLSALIAEEENP